MINIIQLWSNLHLFYKRHSHRSKSQWVNTTTVLCRPPTWIKLLVHLTVRSWTTIRMMKAREQKKFNLDKCCSSVIYEWCLDLWSTCRMSVWPAALESDSSNIFAITDPTFRHISFLISLSFGSQVCMNWGLKNDRCKALIRREGWKNGF